MKTRMTKAATVGATIGIVAALLAMSGALVPVLAATPTTSSTNNTTTTTAQSGASMVLPTLAVGQTFTITSSQGHFRVVGTNQTGAASGTATFTVTGKFSRGYSLSLTAGSLSVNDTTYTISSGSAEMGAHAHQLVGQGTTTSTTPSVTTPGSFLMRATARGTFAGEFATMSLDLQSGQTEYAILLVGTVQG